MSAGPSIRHYFAGLFALAIAVAVGYAKLLVGRI